MDLATLGVRIASDGSIVRTAGDLDKLDHAAGRAERSTSALSSAFRMLTPIVSALGAAFSIRALVQYGDAWSDMQSRIGAAVKDMEAAPALMRRMVDIANASYSPLAQTAEVYSRNMATLRDYGRSAMEAADFTEALNHALVITATKGQDADVVINAYSRAIANGKLRTMEFETIMSRSPRLLEAVADHMGVTVTQLRALAAQGRVTGEDLIAGPINSLELLAEQAGKMPATVGDAIVRLQTNFGALVGRLDQALGSSEALASSMVGLADAIKHATEPVIAVFTMIADEIERVLYWAGALALYWGGPYVVSVVAARVATFSLVGALTALRSIMIRTGVGALVVLLGDLAYQFMQLKSEVEGVGEAVDDTAQRGLTMGQRFEYVGKSIEAVMNGAAYGMEAAFLGGFAAILSGFKEMILGMKEPLNAFLAATGSSFRITEDGMARQIDILEQQSRRSNIAAGIRFDWAGQYMGMALDFSSPEGGVTGGGGGRGDGNDPLGLGGAAGKLNAYQEAVNAVREGIQTLEQQTLAFGLSETAATRFNTAMDLLRAAEEAKIPITGALIDEINAYADATAMAEERTRLLQQQQQLAIDINNTLAQGFSSMFKGIIDGSKNAGQAIGDLLAQLGQLLINQAFMTLFGGGAGGGIGGGIASFLFGGPGFAGGGYTGSGPTHQPAGVVHAGEYVFSAAATNRLGVGFLDALHGSARGYASGGYVIPPAIPAASSMGGGTVVQVIDQRTNAPAIEQEETIGPNGERQIRLIVRDEVSQWTGTDEFERMIGHAVVGARSSRSVRGL